MQKAAAHDFAAGTIPAWVAVIVCRARPATEPENPCAGMLLEP